MKAKYLSLCLIVFASVAAVRAQTPAPAPGNEAAPPSAPPQPSEADLEKLVAPIALYPDPLLATLLPASAYPLDIVKAARFIKNTNNIPKVDSQPWDSNVKALAEFPDVLNKMNDDIDWTSDLGDAFVNNQKGVMNAIQVMRNKAHDAGNLKTTPQQVVTVTNEVVQQTVNQQVVVVTNTVVQVQPASTQVIYVPQYNPAVVYAAPPPGAYAATAFVSFGMGMMWGAAMANHCNWHSGGVYHGDINVNNNINVNRNNQVNRNRNNQTARANRNGNNNAARANGNVNNRNGAGRSGGAYGGANNAANGAGNFGGGNAGGQKWQADSSRRTSNPGASQASRGYGGGGNAGRSDAFSNYGGGSQTRAASNRGGASRGSGGSFGGNGGGSRAGGGGFGGGGRSGGGFRGGGGRGGRR